MRTTFGTIFVVLACLLAAPAVAAYALAGEVTDKQRYLDAVTPLADDPAVQQTVTDQLTSAMGGQVPEAARALVEETVAGFVKSPEFRELWVRVNTEAHPQLLAMLRGEQNGSVAVQGDAIVLNLGSVAEDVKQRMIADGVPLADQIPQVDASVQLMSGPSVSKLVPAFDLLEKLSIALPVAVLLLLFAGVALSARRGRTLVVGGIGLVVMMLFLVLFTFLARSQVTAQAPDARLAGSFYDALTSDVVTIAWFVCALGGLSVVAGGIIAAARGRREAAEPQRPYQRSYSH